MPDALMRAAVLTGANRPLEVLSLLRPRPQAGEVLIKIHACGVCHTDLHVMKGEVAFPTPAVLGHEISGTVAEVGPGVTALQPDDRVVSSFIMPCGDCRHCVRGREDLCETFFALNRLKGVLYDGTTRLATPDGNPVAMYSMGGIAEFCVVPATDVFQVPESIGLGNLATLGCSMLTAYGAVRNVADIRPGDDVAVVAVGGVGSAVIQLAKVFGARHIIAIDLAPDKLAKAIELGATHAVEAGDDDTVAEAVSAITQGRGVDIAFEALGSPRTFRTACSLLGDNGAAVVIGIAPAGMLGEVDLARLTRRKLRILGSYGGRPRTDMPAIIDLVTRGVLQPEAVISRRYDLDHADDAYRALAAGEIVGRAVIEMGA